MEPPHPPSENPPEQDLLRSPLWAERPSPPVPNYARGPIVPEPTPVQHAAAPVPPTLTPPAQPAGLSGTTYPTATPTPRWPAEPPTVGHPLTAPGADAGTPLLPPDQPGKGERHSRRSRTAGLVVLALLALSVIALGSFLFGRSVADDTASDMPISNPAPTLAAPTATVEQATPTAPPEPEQAPRNDSLVPTGPAAPDAVEPVAEAASVVAPAVVLIQHEQGQGSGIVYTEDGLILTNAHVVGNFTEVGVKLASGVTVRGEVLGADPQTDVAVISIDTDAEFGVAVLAPMSSVQVGQLAVAIGSPFGLDQTVTSGIVSAVGRVVDNVAMIQTDAPINPGNSGGALADRQGRVIGMNSSIRTDGSGGNIGVGFAIPSDTAFLIANRIVNGQPLDQGFLGISGADPIIGTPGASVREVTPGSGADQAGILPDDLIVGFNGTDIRGMGDLAAAVRLQVPDQVAIIDINRGGEIIQLEVMLGRLGE